MFQVDELSLKLIHGISVKHVLLRCDLCCYDGCWNETFDSSQWKVSVSKPTFLKDDILVYFDGHYFDFLR